MISWNGGLLALELLLNAGDRHGAIQCQCKSFFFRTSCFCRSRSRDLCLKCRAFSPIVFFIWNTASNVPKSTLMYSHPCWREGNQMFAYDDMCKSCDQHEKSFTLINYHTLSHVDIDSTGIKAVSGFLFITLRLKRKKKNTWQHSQCSNNNQKKMCQN